MLDTLIVGDTKGSGSRDKDDNEDSDEDHNGGMTPTWRRRKMTVLIPR